MKKWERELLLLENTIKRPTFGADDAVAGPTMFAIRLVPRVGLAEVKRLQDISGKIKKLIEFAWFERIQSKIKSMGR